ncbi:hypothetical protein MTP99_013877 [Tenebrio molitor]|nr:hypothetical protein MTP99_013877 [Tenebrio molitor]
MSYSGANNSRSRHQAPPTCIQQPGHPQTPTHPLPRQTLKKSRKRANLLYRIRGRIRGCDPKTLYHTYKSFIRPVIEYPAKIYSEV